MNGIGKYMMTLVCAGILSALVLSIGGDKGAGGSMRKMLCGLFVTVVAIAPLRSFDPGGLTAPLKDYTAMAQSAAEMGMTQAHDAIMQSISQQARAYILDKAEAMGVELDVHVEVDTDTLYPVFATLTGRVSPREKEVIAGILEEDLLIERSAQQWKN